MVIKNMIGSVKRTLTGRVKFLTRRVSRSTLTSSDLAWIPQLCQVSLETSKDGRRSYFLVIYKRCAASSIRMTSRYVSSMNKMQSPSARKAILIMLALAYLDYGGEEGHN